MKRREFITALGGAAAWPLVARAQPADRIARVGFFGADLSDNLFYPAFIDELQIRGFKNGQNLIVDFRRMEQDLRALSADAAELVQSNVNVLVTQGTEPALQAALGATRTLPIVMIAANFDPFAKGYVKSLARPDGNVTGVFLRQTELAEKQTEALWQVSRQDADGHTLGCHLGRPVQRRRAPGENLRAAGAFAETGESAL